MKSCSTAVSCGHSALDLTVIPFGTAGYLLGRFAGAPLCNQGLDYRRDAGHGASCIVSVRDIGVRSRFNETSIAAGMAFIGETVCYEDVTIRISASIGLQSATIGPLGISLSGVELLIEEGLATVSFFLRKIAVQI